MLQPSRVSLSVLVLWWASVQALTPFSTDYLGVDKTPDSFKTLQIRGFRPDSLNVEYPLFVYLSGTRDFFASESDMHIVKYMAEKGFVAATIEYENDDMCLELCQDGGVCNIALHYGTTVTIYDKVRSITRDGGAMTKLCNLPKTDCAKGIAVSGFDQGGYMALLMAQLESRVTALFVKGVGHIKTPLWQPNHHCVTNVRVSQSLLQPKRRYVNGEHDRYNIDTALDVFSGYVCQSGDNPQMEAPINCIQSDGSGYYIVSETEFTQADRDLIHEGPDHSIAGHNFFNAYHPVTETSPMLPEFANGTGHWTRKSCLDWLADAAFESAYIVTSFPPTPKPPAVAPTGQPVQTQEQCGDTYEKFSAAPKMCKNCNPLEIVGGDRCKYNLTDCQNVAPGQQCTIPCAFPYEGTPTTATCQKGNSNPAQSLDWTYPICECPDPVQDPVQLAKQGYKRAYTGGWECAEGFAPIDGNGPQKRCGCDEEHGLEGCARLVECAPPQLDNCSYDITGCESVQPGQVCTVRCKEENGMSAGTTIASCNSTNTDPLRELYWFPLRCTLVDCPDQEGKQGYELVDGNWQCAEGYAGTVVKECTKGPQWTSTCGATTVLTGCLPIVDCQPPDLITPQDNLDPFDKCRYSVLSCLIPHNSTCEISCAAPYEGTTTKAFCPYRNTDPAGLIWTRPVCNIMDCDEPADISNAYVKVGNADEFGVTTYKCAASYTGTPTKLCQESDHSGCPAQPVGILPVLSGCTQLKPCGEPEDASVCQHQTSDCASVQPGSTCMIRCKAPFVGEGTIGTCSSYNTESNGLIWDKNLMNCMTGSSCADPLILPDGYSKGSDGTGLVCSPGYYGTVEKMCVTENCTSIAELQGCHPLLKCLPYSVTGKDKCIHNISTECLSGVMSGGSCMVGCNEGYSGTPGVMTCPEGNILADTPLEGNGPSCECPDPTYAPGYNKTSTQNVNTGEVFYKWVCDQGYLGKPAKDCNPMPPPVGACDVQTSLRGCAPPIPCAAAPFIDMDTNRGSVGGVIAFGPAQVDFDINEDWVWDYRVFFADKCGNVLTEITTDATAIKVPKGSTQNPPGQMCSDISGEWARSNDSEITTFTQTGCEFHVNEKRFPENNTIKSIDGLGSVSGTTLYLYGWMAEIRLQPARIDWPDGHVWIKKAAPVKLTDEATFGGKLLEVESTEGFYVGHEIVVQFAGVSEIHKLSAVNGNMLQIESPGLMSSFPTNSEVLKDMHMCCLDDVYEVVVPHGTHVPEKATQFMVFASIPNGRYDTGFGGQGGTAGGRAYAGRAIPFEDVATAKVATGDAVPRAAASLLAGQLLFLAAVAVA